MHEYRKHWDNPNETSIMWLGLLFSMLSLSMLTYHMNQEEPPEYEGISLSLFELYRLRTVQCLIIGDITTCAPYTLEAMVYNIMAEWNQGTENLTKVWTMIGMLVRTALQCGYHRDPSQYPEISVFQGEMRRRVWTLICGLDTLTSFFIGLPSMINNLDYDTKLPSNLHDWELSEEMTILPPARPLTERTATSYLLSKNEITAIIAKIVPHLNSLGKTSYDTILKLDDDLQNAFAELPSYLRFQNRESTTFDEPSLVSRQIQLEVLYHQTVCVLHRKYFVRGRCDDRHKRSYNRCLESACLLLALQNFLYTQAKTVGGLGNRHWYRVSYTVSK
jgi:hypothetical protein